MHLTLIVRSFLQYRKFLTLLVVLSLTNLSSGSGHSGEDDGSISMSDSSRIMAVVAEPSSMVSSNAVGQSSKQKHVEQYSSSFYGSPGVPGSSSAGSGTGAATADYYYTPAQSPYQLDYGHRPGRQLGSLSSSLNPGNLLAMASGYSDSVTEYGDNTASGGGGGWSYGPSHGHGGHGGHGGYFQHGWKSEIPVNYSAVGLLGFLALLSIIQNVLRQMTTTTARPMGGRGKRATSHLSPKALHANINDNNSNDNDSEDYTTELNRVTTLILPLLTAVAHARDGLVPFECTHRHICEANQKLTKHLGPRGRSIASTLTDAIADMLTKEPSDSRNRRMEFSKNYLQEKLIRAAGKIGRNGENCDHYYKFCQQLQKLPTYTIPATMLQNYY